MFALDDNADARAQLAVGESRFQAHYDKLPPAPFDRIQARIRWLNLESLVLFEMHDWAELGRVARATLAAIDDGLGQRAGDSELILRRAVAQTFLGRALLRQTNAPEAVSVLEQAVTGYRETPPVIAFKDDRELYSSVAATDLAEALTQTGSRERARSLMESVLARWELTLAHQPENWGIKEGVAGSLVLLAGLLDPTNAEDAARRQSLLDRAAAILNSPEAQNRLSVNDKEVMAKMNSLRAAAPAKTNQ